MTTVHTARISYRGEDRLDVTRKGAVVEVFALHAAWSKTAGTLHTWSAARVRGLRGTLVRFEEAER